MQITKKSLLKLAFLWLVVVLNSKTISAQQRETPNVAPAQTVVYPRITGYVGIVQPLVAFDSNGTHKNFDGSYTVGLATGINIWKSSKVGFSFEITPIITSANGISRMSNLLFHPGVLAALGKGYTFAGRAAFETSGRYGFTPVLSKVIKKNKNSSYYAAMPLPVRFGMAKPSSFAVSFQAGISF